MNMHLHHEQHGSIPVPWFVSPEQGFKLLTFKVWKELELISDRFPLPKKWFSSSGASPIRYIIAQQLVSSECGS